MLRNIMLWAASNPSLVRLFTELGSRSRLTERFIAGENFESAVEVVRSLNARGIATSLDLLGEGVTAKAEAVRACDDYIQLLEAIAAQGVRSSISIKLTQLGLDVSLQTCRTNLDRILDKARQLDTFVRIDMESSAHTQATLDLFEDALGRFGKRHVGIVIQSYLHRSAADVYRLSELGCNIRLCKGAYKEPPEIAYQKKRKVDQNLVNLIQICLRSQAYTAVASHDDKIIDFTRDFVVQEKIPPQRYEFQMLYGVRRDYQFQLRDQGYRMRCYVPFGTQWAPYFMRRLAERPANVLFIVRAILRD